MPQPLYGAQRPARLLLPPEVDRVRTSGPEVRDLAASAGLFLDPWQEFALDCALYERPSPDDAALWEWAAFEVGILVSRQNGKGAILEARELAGLFLFEENLILHSAHEFKTSGEAFRRVKAHVENTPWMLKRVARNGFSTAHGNEGIELRPTRRIISGSTARTISGGRSPRLRFVARTGGSARGFTADLVVWDEAFNLPETVVGAQLPTLSAVANPQLWYTSSAVDKDVHPYGITLARVRKRALAALAGEALPSDDDEIEGGLAWLEWQADEAAYLAALLGSEAEGRAGSERAARAIAGQMQQAALANPGLGFRLRERKIRREFRAMGLKTYVVERLGIGDWPVVDDGEGKVSPERWEDIADPASRPGDRIALGVEVSMDGRTAAISSAGRREDGKFHIKITDHRPGGGTAWVVPRLLDLCARYDVAAVLLNPAGQAGALVADLLGEDDGLGGRQLVRWSKTRPGRGGLREVSAREYAQACGEFVSDANDVAADRLRHVGQNNLADALREAGTRKLADAWAWDHVASTADITTLVAATLALHAFRVHGAEQGVVPWGEYV